MCKLKAESLFEPADPAIREVSYTNMVHEATHGYQFFKGIDKIEVMKSEVEAWQNTGIIERLLLIGNLRRTTKESN